MTRFYLDHNATSPLRPSAREATVESLAACGNASSVHAEGRAARAAIENARESVAALVGAAARNVIFTSGATEALNLALRPDWRGRDGALADWLLLGATEHVAALGGHGFGDRFSRLAVDGQGRLDLAALDAALALAGGRSVALALQAANNETGVLQPVAEAAAKVHAAGGLVVCDAVQAAGRVTCTFETTGADMLVLSSHKIGGPQGAGALILRDASLHCGFPLIRGGGQERGFRAGTENVAAIAGFGVAAAEATANRSAEALRSESLRRALESELLRLAPEATIFGQSALRLPNTSAFAIPGLSAETMLMAFDLAGVAVSSGSACSSGKVNRSHVLEAMAVAPDLARGALRASFGWSSTLADLDACCAVLAQTIGRIRRKRTGR